MGRLVLRFNLPISWASLARSFSNSTRRRSNASIFLRQSAMSITVSSLNYGIRMSVQIGSISELSHANRRTLWLMEDKNLLVQEAGGAFVKDPRRASKSRQSGKPDSHNHTVP